MLSHSLNNLEAVEVRSQWTFAVLCCRAQHLAAMDVCVVPSTLPYL